MERVLGSRGIVPDDIFKGDIADSATVARALEDCDAVLHAAADFVGGDQIQSTNIDGVRNVVGTAFELHKQHIIYISSVVVLFPPPGPTLEANGPVSERPVTGYSAAKSAGEIFVRSLQDQGASITTFYPSAMYGPYDPGPTEALKGVRDCLRWVWPVTSGGISFVDVRDVADALAAALRLEPGSKRFLVGGNYFPWAEYAELGDRVTGIHGRRLRLPPTLLRMAGRLVDLIKRVSNFDYPLTLDAAQVMTRLVPCNDQPTIDALGIKFRPAEETLRDTIRWLYESGEIDVKFIGKVLD